MLRDDFIFQTRKTNRVIFTMSMKEDYFGKNDQEALKRFNSMYSRITSEIFKNNGIQLTAIVKISKIMNCSAAENKVFVLSFTRNPDVGEVQWKWSLKQLFEQMKKILKPEIAYLEFEEIDFYLE